MKPGNNPNPSVVTITVDYSWIERCGLAKPNFPETGRPVEFIYDPKPLSADAIAELFLIPGTDPII